MDEPFFLYEGGVISDENRRNITRVRIGPRVTQIARLAFHRCSNLVEVRFNEGLKVIGQGAFSCTALRSVTIPSTVTELGHGAFIYCSNLTKVQFNEGLKLIGEYAFAECTALRSVAIPSTVTKLGEHAFYGCKNLTNVQLNEGLQVVGDYAFQACVALRCVTIPSTVTALSGGAFYGCSNLSEVTLLSDERFLRQVFLVRGLSSEEQREFLNQGSLNDFLFREMLINETVFAFGGCPLAAIKISVPRALSDRMERLSQECRITVEERIWGLDRLEVMQDGSVLACFPVVSSRALDLTVEDTNLETARSIHQVVQWIAYHELKESSILIELAIWKSRIDDTTSELPREDCRVAIPDPAKSAIMEYCGFAGFLEPASEG